VECSLRDLNDEALLSRLDNLAKQERESVADVVEHLAEMDRRDLAVRRAYPSLFEYCVKKLGYSEAAAYHRIRAARAAARDPRVVELLRQGDLTIEAVALLNPYLRAPENARLLEEARGKTKREVEAMVARFSPQPQPRDSIRMISVRPVPDPSSTEETPLFQAEAPRDQPFAPGKAGDRVHVAFTAPPAFLDTLERVRELCRHKFPEGRLEDIMNAALEALLERKDPDRWAEPARRGKSRNRRIPRWVRKRVWKRDSGRCAYGTEDGRICGSKDNLEFDHVRPWSLGGTSSDPSNIRLLCRSHNRLAARQVGLGLPKFDCRAEN
jgi:hypothetical protein